MGLVGAIGRFLIFVSITQIPYTKAQETCSITSVTCPGPSALRVRWNRYVGATNYFLDLRVINSTDIAPVVLTLSATATEKVVHGLRPGSQYSVTLKVFNFYFVVCQDTQETSTVPATSQITRVRALSSTSLLLEWARVPSADSYYVVVKSSGGNHSGSVTNTSLVVQGLAPRTVYRCSVFTENRAGRGRESVVKAVLTLVPPPDGLQALQTGGRTANVSWQAVEDILLYEVTVRNQDQPNSQPFVTNATEAHLSIEDIMSCSNYVISVSSVNQFLEPGEPNHLLFTTNSLSPVSAVSVDYSCARNSASVSWEPVLGADSYRATASSNGTVRTCNSSGTWCHIQGVACSRSFVVSVTAVVGDCESTGNSISTIFQSECSTNAIIFSWAQTPHTDYYMATLVDSAGESQHCMTSDISCFFTRTVCGRSYNFTVYSVSGDCQSQSSPPASIKTAPCPPRNFMTSSGCSTDTLINTWEPAEGSLSHAVESFGNRGLDYFYNCSSNSDSCTIHGLHCGQHLTTYVTAFDDECSSRTLLSNVAETVPCVPQNVSATMDCGADSVTVNWMVAPGSLFYTGTALDSSGRAHTCQTMGTSCHITGLQCSSTYTAFVASSNVNCNSSESERVMVETATCPPDQVTASLNCTANQALISWGSLAHMLSFTATAEDPEDGLLSCSTTLQSCSISDLRCGQRYRVSVFHHDGICPSMPSRPVYLQSVACGPVNVSSSVDCASGSVAVEWSASLGADGYTVALTGDDGSTLFRSSSEPHYSLVQTLDCGHQYSLQVTSSSGVPCVPTDLAVQRNCANSSADVSWRASRGAVRYEVSAVSAGQSLGCSSDAGPACRLEPLSCGRLYAVSVVALGAACSAAPSPTVSLLTAPCRPSQLAVSVNCSTNGAALSWEPSPGAVSYSAQALGADGHLLSCDGPRPACLLEGLRCGQAYRTAAPCAPTDVVSLVDCSSSTLAVGWTPASIPLNYSVTAVSAAGDPLSCSTDGADCVLDSLRCGQQYQVWVRATGGRCDGPSSAAQTVHSAPCTPANLHRVLECSSNTVEASWDPAPGALSYVSTLTDAHNVSVTCHTAVHGCSFPGMRCAQRYTFSVVALDGRCNSSVSPGASVTTAPCDPGNVEAQLDCNSGVATVTWTAHSSSPVYYTVLALTPGQPTLSVRSNATSCTLDQLQCGQEYSVMVLAGDQSCNSSVNASTTLTTAPCAPQIQNHVLNCSTNQALVTLTPDAHTTSFDVNATAAGVPSVFCSTADGNCVLDDLSCGRRYTVQAVAHGDRCTSGPSTSFEILTAPCTPSNMESVYTCGSSIALLSWDETRGRESFYASVRAGEHMDSCATDGTHCSVLSLLCGRLYNISVGAVATHCNTPCAPQNVSTSLLCSGNTGEVSWLASAGAASYEVMALGRDGDSNRCSTNTTACSFPNMHCAQTYEITVTPYSDTCRGFTSTPLTFTAGPCPPSIQRVSLQCKGNVGTVSWLPALLADSYQARATGEDGHAHTCTAAGNATQCSFTDLHCDESYATTVLTTERGCQSLPSAPVTLQSALCPPANLTGAMSCMLDVIIVSWAPSLQNATYQVHVGGVIAPLSSTLYTHTGLQCGQNIEFAVTAQDTCTSALSQSILVPTAPCGPTTLSATAQCGTEFGTLTWSPGAGATHHVATVTGGNGHVASCSSNGTSCSVRLECGQRYAAAVVASTSACNSSTWATVDFDSAPCLPDNVKAVLDCNSNSFAVQWIAGTGGVASYTAMAIGSDGSRLSCNTTSSTCTISALRCGLTYSLAVIPSTANCGSIQSADYKIQSAVVSWTASGPDQLQVVMAVSSRGHALTCNSSSTNCTLEQLRCGEAYTLTVAGHTQGCQGQPGSALSLLTAPCVPTLPTATMDCDTSIAVVTWDSALGATSYAVSAQGSRVHNTTCVHSDTTCTFNDLRCGQDYNFTVIASNPGQCHALPSEAITASTGPCPQAHLQASLECSSNTALVSWTPGDGILTYNSSAEAMDTVDHRTCATGGTGCNISSLLCGERYRVSVRGEGLTCPSPSRDWTLITTAPCPPTLLEVASSCDSDVISVSWTPSQGSASYRAEARPSQGSSLHCLSGSTDCQISGLLCGQLYQVFVVGVDADCQGASSDVYMLHTAPCVPLSVHTELDCLEGSLNITWQQSSDALAYVATVTCSEGRTTVCKTTTPHCLVTSVRCGFNYSVSVLSQDNTCNSSSSPAQHVAAVACEPGVLYTATARHSDGRLHNCSAEHSGCSFSSLECGSQYNLSVTPSRGPCLGACSPYQLIRTTPCVPDLKAVEMDCLSESAWVMWEDPVGHLEQYYIVEATDSLGVQRFECNATDAVCAVPNMTCGRGMNFTVMASDQQCTSSPSNMISTETAPCPPLDVRAAVGCENRSASVLWSASSGALRYTATLENTLGQTTCCTSTATGCEMADLPCGEMYVLLVTAEGLTCNSSQSAGIIIRTEPCVPQNLHVSLSCSSNVASVTWDLSRGGQQYSVEARSLDGSLLDTCQNYEGTCELQGLRCGQRYTAAVAAEDSDCISAPSKSVEIRTGPASCVAMELDHCNMTGLSCGQTYRVTVLSSDGYCDSPPTEVVDTHSVPCVTSNIEAHLDCSSRVALLSWRDAGGAVTYNATASARASGHSAFCHTNRTSCVLDELQCGQSYSVSVTTLGHSCSSGVVHMGGELLTEPCTPSHLSTQYALSIGQVMWDPSAGADRYTVAAVTDQGVAVSCGTTDTYCALLGMGCGQMYNVSVTAHNSACNNSVTSQEPVAIQTEPCPPNNVGSQVECGSTQVTVTWETSTGVLGYVATLDGRDGHTLSCHTDTTFCNVEDIHCGTVYYTWVVALGAELNSSASATILITSAPCEAQRVEAQVHCDNDTAEATWDWVPGAQSYGLVATAVDGHEAACLTDGISCQLSELQCGQVYSLGLTAINQQCQTQSSNRTLLSTRPCAPQRVAVDLQCGSSTASLSWEPRDGVERYQATANCSLGYVMQCNSTNGTCQFSGLHCGENHRFSVVAFSSTCQSEVSRTVEIRTEPCGPADLSVTGSCDSQSVTLDWTEARGAAAYVVTASGDLGYVTSYQTNATGLEVDLLCGQSYAFTVQGQGGVCEGPVSAPSVFTAVVWASSDGAESYTAVAVGQDNHTHICSSRALVCSWDDLHCGEVYLVHVVAHHYLCTSSPSNSTSITMAPCRPHGLQASLDCSAKVATLSWNASETADIYSVLAETSGGHQVSLSTVDTSAQFSDFLCGEEYFLSVQAVDSVCRSAPSSPVGLVSVPCPPTSISSSMDCLSNIAVVTWTASAGAEFYTAAVTGADGQSESCLSGSEQCGTPNLECGRNYSVTVTASRLSCDSEPSLPRALQSAPCVPSGVSILMDCVTKEAVVSWNASQGALSYAVTAMSTLGATSVCSGTDPGCTLTNLTCGQSYRVQVLALDNICSSLPSRAAMFNTEPCQPNITSAVVDCYSNSALVDWTYAEGAVSYVTTARTAHHAALTCSTNATNCELERLECGQTYAVSTAASGLQCDSHVSSSVHFISVPCPPSAVVMDQDCSANTARVSWRPAPGADSYLVQAFGMEEHVVDCESDPASSSCLLPGLLCGFTYNVTVLAVSSLCNVTESAIGVLTTAPCVPNLVQAHLDCESGGVSVSWEASHGALFYTAVAQGSGGYSVSLNVSGTTCLFGALPCGLSYGLTVSAMGDACSSGHSAAVQIDTVPCVPQGVAAVMECSNATGLVSWEPAEGGAPYHVGAFGADGHAPECIGAADRCQLPGLHCGQRYDLTLTALDGLFPCRPTNVRSSLPQCPSTLVSVAWEHASGARSYAAEAVTADGNGTDSCNATDVTSCQLTGLQCGQTYNVSVASRDEGCDSMESEQAQLTTAPCPPQNVTLAMQCDEGTLTVSWSPGPDTASFSATVVSESAARYVCTGNGTSCWVTDLPCGQRFTVTVVTETDGCHSEPSVPVEISSVPCVPLNPEGRLDCVTNSAWVSWDSSLGSLSYVAVAEAVGGGHNSSCTALQSDPSCNIHSLKCGTEYVFYVLAANDDCQSGNSSSFTLETGPCAMENITADTECGSNRILVSWQMAAESPFYLVTAEGQDQSLISCNSTSYYCELEGADCGMQYTVIVSASSDKCSSLRSTPMDVNTAPCVPGSVAVGISCEEDGAAVSWSPSAMATSYLLTATGASGDVRTCETMQPNCTLARLPCGEMYTVNVTARDHTCTSLPSTDHFFQTKTSCSMQLDCGSVYNFSVVASDGQCNSSLSAPLQAGAAPCTPASVAVRVRVMEDESWAMAWWPVVDCPGAEYLVYVVGRLQDDPRAQVELLSNPSEKPFFEFLMPCSTVFNLTLWALNKGGLSERTTPIAGITVPCPPTDVTYSGNNQSATVSWEASVFATRYTVYHTSGGNRSEVCSTSGVSCSVSGVEADRLEVTATNAEGESRANSNVTGPVLNRARRDLRTTELLASLDTGLSVPVVLRLEVSGDSLSLEWTPVLEATLYTLVVNEKQNPRAMLALTVDTEFYTVRHLEASTCYCVILSAKNAVTQSSFSPPRCITTGAAI
ncbi:hypothetical protein NHX12_033641 [Muraenolepis orangiensis]|uniref:Fibronectin type-III domain-containing protein n=1 Tax=Muraenolepis orangiensis TaxID=630683 RepID=A0A9Q0E312_9TELE|nr:hypothetical protein NHX12_033641 [Muraenolepis orangiensis]